MVSSRWFIPNGLSEIISRKNVDPSQPAFKPRKVKSDVTAEGSKYRDRATERRLGKDSDFAHVSTLSSLRVHRIYHNSQVEAVLNEFEKRAQDGDSDVS